MPNPILGAGDTKIIQHDSWLQEVQSSKNALWPLLINIFCCHLVKAEIVAIENEEAKKNEEKKHFCLNLDSEEYSDSLLNWDHLFSMNPTWIKHNLSIYICKFRGEQYLVFTHSSYP